MTTANTNTSRDGGPPGPGSPTRAQSTSSTGTPLPTGKTSSTGSPSSTGNPALRPPAPEIPQWSAGLSPPFRLNAPIVDATPFVFNGRLYLLEHWKKEWDFNDETGNIDYMLDELRIRDVEKDDFVGHPIVGFGFGTVMVNGGHVYLFLGAYVRGGTERLITEISLTSSVDLVEWTLPQVVLVAEELGQFLGVSVCEGDGWFVMAVLGSDLSFPYAVVRYLVSENLIEWSPVPEAVYGRETPVISPHVVFETPYYYTLFSRKVGVGYNTYITRSKDLVHWEDAGADRPVLEYPTGKKAISGETNASDARAVFFNGRTRIYYTDGDRDAVGDLKFVSFPGPMHDLFPRFFEDSPEIAIPSSIQQAFQETNVGVMIHFGMTTYTNGDMLLLPDKMTFNPVALNTDQWIQTATNIGEKYAILTAKHYNGFCLWPTVTTSYCVKNSPWKGGKGDVVRDFVDSCRKSKIKPGLYISPGDYNKGVYSNNAPVGQRSLYGDVNLYFRNIFIRQFQELLKNYGELGCVVLDTSHDPFGWDVKSRDGRNPGVACAAVLYKMVRELQPNAAIIGGLEPDVRRVGNTRGISDYPLSYSVNKGEGPKLGLSPVQQGWVSPETLVLPRPNRFWTPGSDDQLMSADDLFSAYYKTVGQGSNLLLNLSPDPRGLIPDIEVNRIKEVGIDLRRRLETQTIFCKDLTTWWEGQVLQLELDAEVEKFFDHIILEEDLRDGQRIQAYVVEILKEDKWEPLAEGLTIGRRRIHQLSQKVARVIRLKITKSLPRPTIRYFGVSNATKAVGAK